MADFVLLRRLTLTRTLLALAGILGFWLSGSVLIDSVIVPWLYDQGMMTQPGFVVMGYNLFETFNHLEVLCGATVMTGILGYVFTAHLTSGYWKPVSLALILLGITGLYTYWLTPQLSGWGLMMEDVLRDRATMPTPMMQLQVVYWGLECLKIVGGLWLLKWCLEKGLTSNSSSDMEG